MNEIDIEATAAATARLIRQAWGRWGTVDDDVAAHVLNPGFTGEPRWPGTRQAHSVTRRGRSIMIASDGLSEPVVWQDGPPSNGYGVEVFGISADPFDRQDTAGVAGSWLGQVVMSTSRLVAQHGFGFTESLERNSTLTVAFPDAELPGPHGPKYIDDRGSLTVLLGMTDGAIPARVAGPLTPIRLVSVKLLTAAEANFCVSAETGSAEARQELVRRFADQGWSLYSSLERPSVVL